MTNAKKAHLSLHRDLKIALEVHLILLFCVTYLVAEIFFSGWPRRHNLDAMIERLLAQADIIQEKLALSLLFLEQKSQTTFNH